MSSGFGSGISLRSMQWDTLDIRDNSSGSRLQYDLSCTWLLQLYLPIFCKATNKLC